VTDLPKIMQTTMHDDSKVILIPTNYLEERVVPICIRTVDDEGRHVFEGWIDAVRPVADPLRRLAAKVLGDINRVSELTEGSVHVLSATHGSELGYTPSTRVLRDAKWRARDMLAGNRRLRVGRDVELRNEMLASLRDPHNFAKAYEDREFLQRLEDHLRNTGQTETLIMLQMYLSECEDDLAEVFGVRKNSQDKNTLMQRFRRTLQRTVKLL
jgi:hypothetical protein